MWEFFANGKLLYRAGGNQFQQLYDIKLSLHINSAGELTFTAPQTNALFGELTLLKTEITCLNDGSVVWCGRIVRMTFNMANELMVECEGALAYLSDVIQFPYAQTTQTADGWLNTFVTNYNQYASADRRIEAGWCNALPFYVLSFHNDEPSTILDEMMRINEGTGAFWRVRVQNGTRYLDFLESFDSNIQEVRFGRNLLDFADEIDAEELYTIGYPIGKTTDGELVDISSVNDGSPFLEDAEAVSVYGRIYRTINTSYKTPAGVKYYGEDEMAKRKTILKTMTCSAVDLADIGVNTEHFVLGDLIRVRSLPHGVDVKMVLSEIFYNIPNVAETVYTIGNIKSSLTGSLVAAEKGG